VTRIGLLSDTHGHLHPRVFDFFKYCDEIWHAGDIGPIEVADKLLAFKPFRAVHGNIDDYKVRSAYPEHLHFYCEGVKVYLTHIGGYPGRYNASLSSTIKREKPALFICGHSHILRVIHDPKYNLLHINPGAAGNSGFHQKITLVRFVVDGNNIKDLEINEIDRNRLV
jgi:uncharacterized protein